MSNSAIIMMIFGFLITWGGAALCLRVAMKKSKVEAKGSVRGESK